MTAATARRSSPGPTRTPRPTASTPAARARSLGNSKADKAFAAGFKKLAHFPVGIYSAEAFDAANTIIYELKILASSKAGVDGHHAARTSSTAFTRSPSRASPRRFHFQSNGNISGTDIYVNQVQKGKLVQLGLE